MDAERQLYEVNEKRKASEPLASEARYEDESRKRLGRIIDKKIMTSFIGAVAKFEEFFGHLWGHGLSLDQELSESENRNLELWNECRNEVLNNGNSQKRALQTELLLYTIKMNRCRARLLPKPLTKKDEENG